jgi:hypothetical protein
VNFLHFPHFPSTDILFSIILSHTYQPPSLPPSLPFPHSFILHHGIAPNLLSGHINSGHNVQINNSNEIHWFIIGHYILGSSLIWQVVNPLVYKINYKYFLAVQPFVILLAAPSEVKSCVASTSSAETTAIAAKVFGTLSEVLDMVHALFLPLDDKHHQYYSTLVADDTTAINNNNNNNNNSPFSVDYAYRHCMKVQSYLLLLCAYCLPAYIIWKLETHARKRFILMLEADGGGKKYSVDPGLMEKLVKSTAELEYPWSSHNVREGHIGRIGGAFLCSCTCWGLLDYLLER